jgi:hypothetical protein
LKELRELGNGSGRPGGTKVAPVTGTGRDGASVLLCEPASSWLDAPVGTQSPIQRAATPRGGRNWSRKVD